MFIEGTGLAARGHDVTLGYTTWGDLIPRYEAASVTAVRLGEFDIPRANMVANGLSFSRALVRAAKVRPDLIVLGQYHDSLFGHALSRLLRIPLVAHLRLFPSPEFCGQWRIGMEGVTRLIAVSGAVREAWEERGCIPGTIDVVHDGVDTDVFKPIDDAARSEWRRREGIPADAFVVNFVGRIDHQKHPEALLRTFAALRLPKEKGRLIITGRPVVHATPEAGQRYLESLKALAAELGITDSVHWLGSRDDVPTIFAASDVTALFTLYPDALPRVLFESMACGVPALAQHDGGTREVLSGEWGRFAFDAGDPERVVALFRSMIDWRTRDPELGRRVREHAVRNFSTEAMIRGIEASFARALEDGAVRRGPPRHRLAERREARELPLGRPVPAGEAHG